MSSYGPMGDIQTQVVTGSIIGGAGTLALAGLAVPGIDAVVAALIVAAFIYGFLTDWTFKIDPSGTVVDTAGNPIAGATATLQSYDRSSGHYAKTPASADYIDPATNPEQTTSAGGFDWDAIAGTYRITASASGCHAPGHGGQKSVATTPFTLPPPAVGLLLTLQCAHAEVPKPTVTALSPSSALGTGGYVIQIDGTGLTHVTAVHFGKAKASGIHVLSPYAIDVTAPAGSGSTHVTVTSSGGTSSKTSASKFDWLKAPKDSRRPKVTHIGPAHGPITGGTTITVRGSHFESTATVAVGGLPATDVRVKGPSRLTALVPAASAAGRASVTVTTAHGTSTPMSRSRYEYTKPALAGVLSRVRHLSVVPSLTGKGVAHVKVHWSLPKRASRALVCLTPGRSAAAQSCTTRVRAGHSATLVDRHLGQPVTVTVYARDSLGDLSVPAVIRLDATTIGISARGAGSRDEITAFVKDTTTHHRVGSGRIQLWRRVGSHGWQRVATAHLRNGRATVSVAAQAVYQWRYPGQRDRLQPALSHPHRG
ncbi:MAG TPA: IPT/TIG domain-containing protein [Mycobacteriales bacterium]|nr:IPT/TIG domain-containing protein [Mycobacteriales bacterium]